MNSIDVAELLAQKLSEHTLIDLLKHEVGGELETIGAALGFKLDRWTAARCVVSLVGINLLSNRRIRKAIVDEALGDCVDLAFADILETLQSIRGIVDYTIDEKRRHVIERTWHPGSAWPRYFCEAFRLPPMLAGNSSSYSLASIEQVDPYIELAPLHDFQLELRDRIMSVVDSRRSTRALLALPTGAGKTRTMVETLLCLPQVENGSASVVWVAQHQELCEQAVQSFAQVWSSKQHPQNRRLTIQRVWKTLTGEVDWRGGIIVGTPESLVPRLERSARSERNSIAVTVIDEAHHANAPSYAKLFSLISHSAIFGMTATPGTSDKAGTKTLLQRFGQLLLVPGALGNDPVAELQKREILAIPVFSIIKTEVVIGSKELSTVGSHFGDLPAAALKALGSNLKRNRLIVERLLLVEPGKSVLCFAASVKASRAIAAALALSSRSARSIDGESEAGYRNQAIDDFKMGRVQFLINYGVLTTGFDAPKVDCLVMARPTTSPVLYEQMLGRGLRGLKNGGTATCEIIQFEDDFTGFGDIRPLSYKRFIGE